MVYYSFHYYVQHTQKKQTRKLPETWLYRCCQVQWTLDFGCVHRLQFPSSAEYNPWQWSRQHWGQLSFGGGKGSISLCHYIYLHASMFACLAWHRFLCNLQGYNRAHNWAELPPECSMDHSTDVHEGPNDSSCIEWVLLRDCSLTSPALYYIARSEYLS